MDKEGGKLLFNHLMNKAGLEIYGMKSGKNNKTLLSLKGEINIRAVLAVKCVILGKNRVRSGDGRI